MFNLFKKNKEPKGLKEILSQFKNLKKDFDKISKEIEGLKEKSRLSVQKTAIIRYNPFSNVGGDQSFSIALLDASNNGVVITSLFTRDGNRVYGKAVKDGKSEYSLSEEEKQVVASAIDKK